MSNELKPGDVVILKSGGPRMTVRSRTADGDLFCNWFNGRELEGSTFANVTLERSDVIDR